MSIATNLNIVYTLQNATQLTGSTGDLKRRDCSGSMNEGMSYKRDTLTHTNTDTSRQGDDAKSTYYSSVS